MIAIQNLLDRLPELPYLVRPRPQPRVPTWPLTKHERSRVAVMWPSPSQGPPWLPIVETFRDGFAGLGVLRVRSTTQRHEGGLMLGCTVDGRPHAVFLDCSDYPMFINDAALAESDLYFKCQFRRDGYKDDRIIPGGYPTTNRRYYKFYLPFRSRYATNRRIGVLGRFGYRFQGELRRRAVDMLAATPDLGFVGSNGKLRYSRFLDEAASARLCLHLPGNGPFTHRVAEFLGLGSCMLSIPFATVLHVPLEAGTHYVEIADDLSDLIDKCRYYLRNDQERERIAKAGQDFFDRNLHCDQLASYHVRTILNRLGRSTT
jgi:hypothetical protein